MPVTAAPEHRQIGGPTLVPTISNRSQGFGPRPMTFGAFAHLPAFDLADALDNLAVPTENGRNPPIAIDRKALKFFIFLQQGLALTAQQISALGMAESITARWRAVKTTPRRHRAVSPLTLANACQKSGTSWIGNDGMCRLGLVLAFHSEVFGSTGLGISVTSYRPA